MVFLSALTCTRERQVGHGNHVSSGSETWDDVDTQLIVYLRCVITQLMFTSTSSWTWSLIPSVTEVYFLISHMHQTKATQDVAAEGTKNKTTSCPGSGFSPPHSIPAFTCHGAWPDLWMRLWWSGTETSPDLSVIIHLFFQYLMPMRRYWWSFLSPSLRHRLLEALRVASVWRHGKNSSHATPVLPYARMAFTHSLTFLNKVCYSS